MRLTVFLVSVLSVAVLTTSATVSTTESKVQPQLMVASAPAPKPVAAQRCFSARQGVSFYRSATHLWQMLRDAERLAGPSPTVRGKSCHWARYAASEWRARALTARRAYKSWVAERTLRDFPFTQGVQPWPKAVREVQRVFPGTESWLLSCSDAEGWEPGSDVWIGYAGVRYSIWLRDSDTVGGPMQFRWSTFKGMFRFGLDYLEERGYRVPSHLRRSSYSSESEWLTAAWRSALGQAIAGGWARYTGNDNSHWSASWGNGC